MSDTLLEGAPAHAPYGPSQAEGYTTCLDYVNANEGLPDDTSKVAAEGTVAHGISDMCLRLGLDAHDFIGTITKLLEWDFEWTEDDAELLQRGMERIRRFEGQFFGEFRVDISEWTIDGQFGTCDRGVITSDLIVVDDLKWGRHVPVTPFENKQTALYGLGFWRKYAPHRTDPNTQFLLSIDQPRNAGGGGEWRTNLKTLLEMGEWIKGRVELGRQPNPPRTASLKGCMWCRRRKAPGGCATFEKFGIGLLGLDFTELDRSRMLDVLPLAPSGSEGMSPERRAFIVRHKSMIVKWLEFLEEQHLADTLAGLPAGELKAVEGKKGLDVWHKLPGLVGKVCAIAGAAALAPAKAKTPLQLSKLVTPEQQTLLEPLIKRGERKPILVPLDDARPALVSGQADFDEEEGS